MFLKSLFVLVACLLVACTPVHAATDKAEQEGTTGRIAFSAPQAGFWQIWTISPDGGKAQLVSLTPLDLNYPAFSPGAEKLAWADSEGNLWVLERGGSPHKLSGLPANCNHPAWSPDGSKIAFTFLRFTDQGEESDLWVADVNQGNAKPLIEQDGIQKYPAWSPDGSMIAYTTGYRANKTKVIEDLWLARVDGNEKKVLLSDGSSNIQPAWSPDGKWIAFASDRGGNMDIWVIGRDGGNLRRLTDDPAYDEDPSWSPDGTKICFTSNRSGQMEIWIMGSDGSDPTQLTHFTDPTVESKNPHWSPMRNHS